MKKLLVLILSVIAAFTAIISLTACEAKVDKDGNVTITDGDKSSNDNNGGSDSSGSGSQGGSETGGEQGGSETGGNEDSGKLSKTEIRSKNLIVSGNEIKGKVVNSQTTFSFINDIEVADGAIYTICRDIDCTQVVLLKAINLNEGDNVCYILVTNGNRDMQLYTVTIRRRPIYTVDFNSNGGTAVDSQQIEEDNLATKPAEPIKTGYNFSGFDYDFNKPIVENTTINASWQIITYNIYYDLNGGTNDINNPKTYTVEDEIELKPASDKLRYTFMSWSDNGVIEKGSTGDKIFTANYKPTTYKITYDCGSGENNANNVTTYNIESDTIKLLDPYYINADFVEWQRGGVKITEIPAGSYGDITLTAVWSEYDVTLKLNSDGKTYAVTGLNTDKADIEIKALTKNITSIYGSAFFRCRLLTSITIPDSVTSIGDMAFGDCDSLTSITIPDSVTSIGGSAFYGCISLASVTIGNGVTSIGGGAFYNCIPLSKIYYRGGVNDWVQIDGISNLMSYGRSIKELYINDKLLTEAVIDTATEIKSGAFENCQFLKSVEIGTSVTSIKKEAFRNCGSLTSVTIGDGVTSIGDYAFSGCKLKSLTIGTGVTSIGEASFSGCKLKSIIIPDRVASIGRYAFDGCTSLTSITIGAGVTSIGDDAFYDNSLVEVINNSSLNITKGSYDNGRVASCALSVKQGGTSDIVRKDDYLFYVYNNVNYLLGYIGTDTELTLPNGYNGYSYEIYKYAFNGCEFTSITIGAGVTSVGEFAFSGCRSLTSVTIGNGVTSIGNCAFSGCYKLVEIIDNSSLNITKESDDNGGVAKYALNVKQGGTSDIVRKGGYLFYVYNNVNYLLGYIGTDTELTLPNDYNGYSYEIYKYAFEQRNSFTSVVIGERVTSVGEKAFYYCRSLTNITIPNGVTSIGDMAFGHCNSLTNITIPDSVLSIGNGAFEDCGILTSVTIGDKVMNIGFNAFQYCRTLTTINYKGTEEQWNSISKGSYWNYGTGSYTINYNYN